MSFLEYNGYKKILISKISNLVVVRYYVGHTTTVSHATEFSWSKKLTRD